MKGPNLAIQTVFVHGWGQGPEFWDKLAAFFPSENTQRIDLGFLGSVIADKGLVESECIYVTHSLGTLWSLMNRAPQIKGLVAINGFYDFRDFASLETLEAMKARLETSPMAQMSAFWRSCGFKPETKNLNIKELQDGLDWLASWDTKERLALLKAPVLSLAARDDIVLPFAAMKEHWDGYSLKIRDDGGHSLPQTQPEWCAEQIREFINGFA